MVRTKIRDLNEKPALRDYLFKKVSDEQLQKDISAIEGELDEYYKIIWPNFWRTTNNNT